MLGLCVAVLCRPPLPLQCYTAYIFRYMHVLQHRANGKLCLSERKIVFTLTSCDVDHVPKSVRLSLHRFSAMGQRSEYNYCVRRRESPGIFTYNQKWESICTCSLVLPTPIRHCQNTNKTLSKRLFFIHDQNILEHKLYEPQNKREIMHFSASAYPLLTMQCIQCVQWSHQPPPLSPPQS